MKKIKINDNNIIDYDATKEQELKDKNINYEIGYICKDCGAFINRYLVHVIYDEHQEEICLCDECTDKREITYCRECSHYYTSDTLFYTNCYGTDICSFCKDNYYINCDYCGGLIPRGSAYSCSECGVHYCSDCTNEHYNQHYDGLYSYHSFNDWQCKKLENESDDNIYIGHELEIDNGDNRKKVIELINDNLPCICMKDGSLSDKHGIEIISHPMTYDYLLSIEKKYKEIFNKLTNDYNYRSHETNTCGLHVHITKPKNEEVIDRILLFMETYKEEITQLSRRTNSEILSWCQFLSDIKYCENKDSIKSLEYIKKNKDYNTKMLALNLQHANTIEFRIFKGTLNFNTFMSSIEFAYNLVKQASDLSLPINKLNWKNVTSKGKYLPTYIKEHNLTTNKGIKDFTRIIVIKRNRKRRELKEESIMLYKEMLKEINDMTINYDKKIIINKMIDTNKLERYATYTTALKRNIRTLKDEKVKITDYELNRIENDLNIIKRNVYNKEGVI